MTGLLVSRRVALSLSLVLAGTTAPAHAQARPAAADIVARYVAAIGGKDAILKVTSMTQVGKMEVPAVGLSADMTMHAAAPDKAATRTNLQGIGEILAGYNGTIGWDLNPMQGPRLLTGKELAAAADNADFHGGMLYSPDRYSAMETVGDTTIRGEKAYVVSMTRKRSGAQSTAWFSATSGLLLGMRSTTDTQMGSVTSVQLLSDYKPFGALTMPTRIEQSVGPQTIQVSITGITFNATPDSVFAVPAAVKPLIKP